MTSPLQLAGTGQPCRAYAELQAVSNFSFLTGGSHPDELVVTAKALGLEALGIADRNTLAGVVRAHVAAKEAGLRLLVGARLDLMDALSLICYPTDRAAYGRLCRLLSLGQSRALSSVSSSVCVRPAAIRRAGGPGRRNCLHLTSA